MTSIVTMMTMLLRGMMHKALYPFLFLLVLGFNLSTAVGARGDSLRYELRKASVDSVRFSLYQQLVYTLLDSSLDAAVPFFVEWVDVALRSKTWSEAGRAEAIWGVAALQSGTLSDASTHFSRAIRYYDNAGESKGLGRAYNNLGITLRREGRFKEAFLSFLEARKQFQLADDAAGIAMVYNNLAQIYYQYEEYGQALEYFTYYLNYNRAQHKALETANAENNIGATYYELKDYSHALEHYYRSYDIFDSLDYRLGFAMASDNIGLMLRELGQLDDAVSHHQRAVQILQDSARMYQLTQALGNLCTAYRLMGETRKAVEVGNRAYTLADSLDFEELRTLLLEEVALTHESLGDYRSAFARSKMCIEGLKKEIREQGREHLNTHSLNTQLLTDIINQANDKTQGSEKGVGEPPAMLSYLLWGGVLFLFGALLAGAGVWIYWRRRLMRAV